MSTPGLLATEEVIENLFYIILTRWTATSSCKVYEPLREKNWGFPYCYTWAVNTAGTIEGYLQSWTLSNLSNDSFIATYCPLDISNCLLWIILMSILLAFLDGHPIISSSSSTGAGEQQTTSKQMQQLPAAVFNPHLHLGVMVLWRKLARHHSMANSSHHGGPPWRWRQRASGHPTFPPRPIRWPKPKFVPYRLWPMINHHFSGSQYV
jgi:hypothetical protein